MKLRILLLSAAAVATTTSQAQDIANGERLARERCARCHAVERHDVSPFPGAPPLRDLHLRYPLETLEEGMAEGLSSGHPAMPVFTFEPREIEDFLAYLRSLEDDDAPEPPAIPGRG